jgi:3-methylfumaryl-CoA hydratase
MFTTAAGEWQPQDSIETDVVTSRSVGALNDLLDDGSAPAAPDGALPILWHWLAFLPRSPQHALDADGHPRRGGFLPPVPLPRRMFVGSRVELAGELAPDSPLERRGRVTSVKDKTGRSGPLVFVTARFELFHPGGAEPLLAEEQDIVYREASKDADSPASRDAVRAASKDEGASGQEDGPEADSWTWRWDLGIDPSLLFRFSALTYNAHRIHYDREWATGVEGYPGLVVHGPLQAVALAELCRRNEPGAPVRSFAFRAVQPKFDDGPLLVRGRPAGDGTVELAAFDHYGVKTMQAEAVLAP